jgi:hypothetical protein
LAAARGHFLGALHEVLDHGMQHLAILCLREPPAPIAAIKP